MTRLFSLTRVGATAALASGSLSALALSPGDLVVEPAGLSLATAPWLAGTVVEDTVVPFSYPGIASPYGCGFCDSSGNITGTVASRVVKSVDGTFDFYWKVSVDDTSFLPVAELTLHGLRSGVYGAAWRRDLEGDMAPAIINMWSNNDIAFFHGQFITGSHLIRQGESSHWLLLDSQATAYAASGTYSLRTTRDGSGSGQYFGDSGLYSTFVPVPEPSAGILAMLGLAGIVALSRWSCRGKLTPDDRPTDEDDRGAAQGDQADALSA